MESCRMYGLEFNSFIEFDNYEGGVKLTKRLHIKNTTKNIIRFRFLFQSSTYFTYPVQEIENISPGLNKSYLISFLNPLNDLQTICEILNILIDDKTKDKKISIQLKATPLKCDIIIPSVLNLNEMVIKQKTKEDFVIKNQGTLNAIIKLSHKIVSKEKKLKIKFDPSQFILKANEKKSIKIIIYSEIPQKYNEFISTSIIEIPKHIEKNIFQQEEIKNNDVKDTNKKKEKFEKYKNDDNKKKHFMNTTINTNETEEAKNVNDIIHLLNEENINVCLIKKKTEINFLSVLPQINILFENNKEVFNKSILNFGKITIGQKVKKTIYLQNLTNSPIKIIARKQKEKNIFILLNEKILLKEKNKEEIIISIDSSNPVNQYTEIIQFIACNDYCVELFLICEIVNIKLFFSKTLYLFENVKIGDNVNEKVTIRNDENADLDVDVINTGNFINIKNKKFTIKKNSFHSLNLICNCIYPINIYKRIYFLVHLNKQIFYIDIICNFSINYKMCPLSINHIYRYKHLIHDKETIYTSYYEKNDYIDIWDFPVEFDTYEDTAYDLLNEIMEINQKDIFIVPKELEVLEFEEKDIMIMNKTPIEYTCVWTNGLNNKKKEHNIFEVTPVESQLLPFSYQIFRVKNIKVLKEKYIREIYECIVFPSNNKDYRKCNSKTLLPPLFLYVTFFQFKIKYLCETDNVMNSLFFSPKQIFFLNMIEEENNYTISKFENNTDITQIIDFTQFKNDVESIRIYPLINYVPKNSFLNVIIFYSPQKKNLVQSEIKISYLINGIEKNYISVFVSHEMNNVMLNKGELDINLPRVSTETEIIKKVPIENMTERNVLCFLIKKEVDDIVNIHIEGKKNFSEQQEEQTDHNIKEELYKEDILNDIENQWENNQLTSFKEEKKIYNFYYFSLLPFEKKNLHIYAYSNTYVKKSIPLFFTYLLYINNIDMKNKIIYLNENLKDHIKSCKKFNINVNIIKCCLKMYPKIIESNPITSGTKFNAKVRIQNEHPVKINYRTKTKIYQIDDVKFLDEEETKEAEKNIVTEDTEDMINSCSAKYFYVSFNTNKKGRFVYRFFVIVGENENYIDIIVNVVIPYFQIIDINDFKTPTSIYWNMTSIDKINMYLKDNISNIDMEYKQNQGIENMKKLFNNFNYIDFNIGNNTLNEITSVNLILYNPLDISLYVEINTIKSYILPILPPYVKTHEDEIAHILYVDNTFNNFMRCLDSCEISPTKFTIKEKGTKTVTLFYKHKYIGFHNMPLIIDIENGKVVPLNLCALTFHPNIPPIYLMNIKELNEHILGIKNECILNIDMLNDSEVDIYYDIEKNNNFMVLNPKGIIKRKKYLSVFILLSKLSPSIINDTMIMNSYFKHLQKNIELKKIEIELTLNTTLDNIYKDQYKKINLFNNKCINDIPDQNIKTFCSNFIPPYSYIYVQNKLFYISPSSINILYAPTNSLIERIVIIKNYSSLKDLKFKVSNKNTLPGSILRIYPNKGIVKKEEQIILRFTFILNDVLIDIEGNIQIELMFVETEIFEMQKNEQVKYDACDVIETNIEEVYEDTRDKTESTENKVLSLSERKKKKRFDDLTFSHAQKIFDNIQKFKYTYDNMNTDMLQNAIRRLYGVKNDDIIEKENFKEQEKHDIQTMSKFYFYIHVKLFTCNVDNLKNKKKMFENLIETNIYSKSLYFKKYINLPIPFEERSKSFFKRHYLDFDKLEKLNVEDEKNKDIPINEKFIYQKKDIYCCMFAEMFKSIIRNHIKKYITYLLKINTCSIQEFENILEDDLIDIMTRNKILNSNLPVEYDYTFLNPTIISHFFSHMFTDIIDNLMNEKINFKKRDD
ncbi:hypothetical protein PFUGPA_05165 [Plasmodium falciparum Palo Alto/Uganda]|uniref:CFAP65-like ninth Ig-like domain-containing protein n=1 Tax=Plasmodium falciparum (isolate Palo Alto / Uganda) TaxID=57270 RepID=W4IU32_PLAFP|nr:hypothetical protein PFUGPA_05165 [Plasmodium falciparum Palo Alto/Uganda]